MADLSDEIEANAEGPKSASVDGNTVTQHSLQEQIAADKYLAGREATAQPHKGLRFAKWRPPGTV